MRTWRRILPAALAIAGLACAHDSLVAPDFQELSADPTLCPDEECTDVEFAITEALVYYLHEPGFAWGKTAATHNAVFEGSVQMTRDGTALSWTTDIGSDGYGWSDVVEKQIDATGPCSTGTGYIHFGGNHYAERNLARWQTDQTTSSTSLQVCDRDTEEEEVVEPAESGGGGDDPTLDDGSYSYCLVRYTYWADTGEIISRVVLYCW